MNPSVTFHTFPWSGSWDESTMDFSCPLNIHPLSIPFVVHLWHCELQFSFHFCKPTGPENLRKQLFCVSLCFCTKSKGCTAVLHDYTRYLDTVSRYITTIPLDIPQQTGGVKCVFQHVSSARQVLVSYLWMADLRPCWKTRRWSRCVYFHRRLMAIQCERFQKRNGVWCVFCLVFILHT